MNTPKETLIAARALIADPDKWTQGYVARTEKDIPVAPCVSRAGKWCAQGAVARVDGGFHITQAERFLDSAAMEMGYDEEDEDGPSANLNDHATHAEVLAMFDRAIELAS